MPTGVSIRIMALFAFGLTALGAAEVSETRPRAALVRTGIPGESATVVREVASALGRSGYDVETLDADALCDPERLRPGKYELLALPDAADLPLASHASIDAYLKNGGDILALNAPLWQRSFARVRRDKREVWEDYESYRAEYARKGVGRLPEHVLFGFEPDAIKDWKRGTNKDEPAAIYDTVAEGPVAGQRSFHAMIPELSGWETLGPLAIDSAFPPGHTLTVFCAKGAPETTELSVEWAEKDGSRWIAVVPLTTDWRFYVLEPKDFKYWTSLPSRANDIFHPENAVRMAIGLALTHTHTRGPRHEYWVGPFGAAKPSDEFRAIAVAPDPPLLDALSPRYALFETREAKSLMVRGDQTIAGALAAALPVPSIVRSPHPRPRGAGFGKGIRSRWIPIVEAATAEGEWRGDPVTLVAHSSGPYKGGLWASFGVGDSDWYTTKPCLELIEQIARRMAQGVFIVEGGANYYTYFDDQTATLGVRAANLGRHDSGPLIARVRVVEASTEKEILTKEWPISLAPGEERSVSDTWRPDVWPEAGFVVTAEIDAAGKVIDRVSHEAHVWRPRPEKHFVSVKDGQFILDGQPWRPHGVNYMPSSGIATEDWDYFEHWIGARSYDPEVIERDLRQIKALGMNAVSIFIHQESVEAQNLVDILRRIDALGMKANVALRPGTPMEFPWEQVRGMIERQRLPENDTVFAYDLAWEPVFGAPSDRAVYDAEWRNWVVERYGSIASAEEDWAFAAPRTAGGEMASPDGKQLTEDGEWRRMSAAYRRFLDTLLYSRYGAARRLVRNVDPHHLVSFRMAEAGNPTCLSQGFLPYDFPYLAMAVDFLAPEGYGRLGDWEHMKPALFEYEYARWAAPDKPVIWAEAGVSAWAQSSMESPPALLAEQGAQYQRYYRMLVETGSNGVFFWWYPGGYRCGENSDYGLINPDGSDRPATTAIRENGHRFLDRAPAPRPVALMEFDRDAHAAGLPAVYESLKDAFWRAREAGKAPALRTAGTGTTSANCPLLAVGNTPCNGHNPPKYLDAAFDQVEVRLTNGEWHPLDGHRLADTAEHGSVVLRVTLTNLGEAAWLSPGKHRGAGAVYLVVGGARPARVPLPSDVAHANTVIFETPPLALNSQNGAGLTLSLMAEGRTPFGQRVSLTPVP